MPKAGGFESSILEKWEAWDELDVMSIQFYEPTFRKEWLKCVEEHPLFPKSLKGKFASCDSVAFHLDIKKVEFFSPTEGDPFLTMNLKVSTYFE